MNKRSNRWHAMQTDDVLRAFSTNQFRGLSSREALARRLKNGKNALWSIDLSDRYPSFLRHICDYATILFVLSVCLSAIFVGGTETVSIAVLLMLSVALRSAAFFFAKNVFRINARYMCPRCRVMRDGKSIYIFADQVVEGDILLLSPGDTLPGDTRLISGVLMMSELYLEKERRRISKNASGICAEDAIWTERTNILYAASTVLSGNGIGIVVSVGEQTLAYARNGHIPLPREDKSAILNQFTELGRTVSLSMMVVCGIYLLIGLFAKDSSVSVDELFLSSIALVVASAGELLDISLRAGQAGALQRMNTELSCVVKSPSSIEKIAQAEWLIIGSERLLQSGEIFIYSWHKVRSQQVNCSDITAFPRELSEICGCIERCFSEQELLSDINAVDKRFEVQEIVSALRKKQNWPSLKQEGGCLCSTICNGIQTSLVSEENMLYAYICGSADDVIGCCSKIMENNAPRPITSEDIAALQAYSRECVKHARRTLAVAKRISPVNHLERPSTVQNSMIFLGCIAVTDTIDREVRGLVDRCRASGIRIALLCDDRYAAGYIAAQTNIFTKADASITGGDDEISEYLSATDTGNLLVQCASDKKHAVVQAIKKRTRYAVYLGEGLSDLSIIKSNTSFSVENDPDRSVDAVSRGADAVVSISNQSRKRDGISGVRVALQTLAQCRGTVMSLFWVVFYLLTSQSLRAVLALFCVCMNVPLLLSSHLLLLGCVVDFMAAMYIVLRRSDASSLSVKREYIRLPRWSTGLFAAVGIGVLSGLLLSLALFVMVQFFTLFDDASIGMMRLFCILSVSVVTMLLCVERQTNRNYDSSRISVISVGCAVLVTGLLIATVLVCSVKLHVIDWRVWLISCLPSVITGIMLSIYKRIQKN